MCSKWYRMFPTQGMQASACNHARQFKNKNKKKTELKKRNWCEKQWPSLRAEKHEYCIQALLQQEVTQSWLPVCVFVYLCVHVWSSCLIFSPLLAAGMTRGNMLARLHYQSLVDPTLAASWRVKGWEHKSLGKGREDKLMALSNKRKGEG